MARKNLIGVSSSALEESTSTSAQSRPLAGMVATPRSPVPVGGITRTLGNITQKMERAQDIERQLAEGQTIVELDPSLVDGSFIKDRLEIDPIELSELVGQIRDHGQQVPILVRPHPDVPGHYQIAYGHRRLAAVRELGRKAKAVIRNLTDDELVISQGQENNARTNLSYIERALFAFQLEERGFGRDTVMSSIGVDKAALSKMITVARALPLELITAIGSAPQVGRRRWMELVEVFNLEKLESVVSQLSADNQKQLPSEERFQIAFSALKNWGKKSTPKPAAEVIANVPVRVNVTKFGTSFAFDTKRAPGFDEYVKLRLLGLFKDYLKETGD